MLKLGLSNLAIIVSIPASWQKSSMSIVGGCHVQGSLLAGLKPVEFMTACVVCSGFFGFFAYPEMKYQKWGMSCSTFWGAWAFLLGSYIQLFEMLN